MADVLTRGANRIVEHTGADSTVIARPPDASSFLTVEAVSIRTDGATTVTLEDTGGGVVDKLYLGAFGVEGNAGRAIPLPLGYGLRLVSDGPCWASIEIRS